MKKIISTLVVFILWLARIIEAEAGGEPYQGRVAVGNVVLNRVKSNDFSNNIYDVIFEYYGSIPQFSPVADGTIYNNPSQASINAAKDALNGARPVGNSTYFFNPDKAAGSWIVNNKSYLSRIGGHVFYQMTDEGIQFEETLEFLKEAQEYVNLICLSRGTVFVEDAIRYLCPSYLMPHMLNADYAKIVKENVDIPVQVVGNIFNLEEAEKILAEGKADVVGICRSLMAGPTLIEDAVKD